MSRTLVISLLSLTTLTFCDRQSFLMIRNATERPVHYEQIAKPASDRGTLSFPISPGDQRGTMLGFGFAWTEELTTEYANDIQSITITYADSSRVTLRDSAAIRDFFGRGRRRLLGKELRIKIGEDLGCCP